MIKGSLGDQNTTDNTIIEKINQCLRIHDPTAVLTWIFNPILITDRCNILKYLIEKDADINKKYDTIIEMSLLHYAISHKNYELTVYLLQHKIDINSVNIYGDNSLIVAIGNNCYPTIQLLINHGININSINNYGCSIIQYAIGRPFDTLENKCKIVNYLLDHGVNVFEKNIHGDNLAMYAALYRNYDIIEHIINKGVDINDTNTDGETLLMYIAYGSLNYQLFEYLCSKGAFINVEANNKSSVWTILESKINDEYHMFSETEAKEKNEKILKLLKDTVKQRYQPYVNEINTLLPMPIAEEIVPELYLPFV